MIEEKDKGLRGYLCGAEFGLQVRHHYYELAFHIYRYRARVLLWYLPAHRYSDGSWQLSIRLLWFGLAVVGVTLEDGG